MRFHKNAGAIAFTFILYSAHSSARHLVSVIIPPLRCTICGKFHFTKGANDRSDIDNCPFFCLTMDGGGFSTRRSMHY